MEFLDIVNKKDEVIGKAPREKIYKEFLTHRIVHVLVFNDKEEMALQLRSKHVDFCPNHWCTTAGGHVKSGETYEEAALRELEEEVGRKVKLKFAYKDIFEYKKGPRKGTKILTSFISIYNGPFKINSEAVEKVGFFSLEKIQNMINRGEKFHPELLFLLKKHFGVRVV